MIFSEGCLHGAQRAALTSGSYRLVLDLDHKQVGLWQLDEFGQGDAPVADAPLRDAVSGPLFQAVEDHRGTLESRRALDTPALLTPEAWEQLRLLGYVE